MDGGVVEIFARSGFPYSSPHFAAPAKSFRHDKASGESPAPTTSTLFIFLRIYPVFLDYCFKFSQKLLTSNSPRHCLSRPDRLKLISPGRQPFQCFGESRPETGVGSLWNHGKRLSTRRAYISSHSPLHPPATYGDCSLWSQGHT